MDIQNTEIFARTITHFICSKKDQFQFLKIVNSQTFNVVNLQAPLKRQEKFVILK